MQATLVCFCYKYIFILVRLCFNLTSECFPVNVIGYRVMDGHHLIGGMLQCVHILTIYKQRDFF